MTAVKKKQTKKKKNIFFENEQALSVLVYNWKLSSLSNFKK